MQYKNYILKTEHSCLYTPCQSQRGGRWARLRVSRLRQRAGSRRCSTSMKPLVLYLFETKGRCVKTHQHFLSSSFPAALILVARRPSRFLPRTHSKTPPSPWPAWHLSFSSALMFIGHFLTFLRMNFQFFWCKPSNPLLLPTRPSPSQPILTWQIRLRLFQGLNLFNPQNKGMRWELLFYQWRYREVN